MRQRSSSTFVQSMAWSGMQMFNKGRSQAAALEFARTRPVEHVVMAEVERAAGQDRAVTVSSNADFSHVRLSLLAGVSGEPAGWNVETRATMASTSHRSSTSAVQA